MGILRFLLALSVLLAHSNSGVNLVGGVVAVQLFFMISGFYMALILHEKYTGSNAFFSFISNRFLRIYPTYWMTLLLTGLIIFINNFILHPDAPVNSLYNLFSMNWALTLSIVTSNLLIIGQDWLLFFNIDLYNQMSLAKSIDVTYPSISLNYLLIPQSWTLSLELVFYLIAPSLMRLKTLNIFFITMLIIASKIKLMSYFGLDDPWSYRFFLFELPFFLTGIMSYRAYNFFKNKNIGKLPIIALILSVLFIISYPYFNITYKDIILYLLIAFALPFVFMTSQKSKLDRMVGELSYPIYLTHLLVIGSLAKLGIHALPIVIGGGILMAISMHFFVEIPIERYRQRRWKGCQ